MPRAQSGLSDVSEVEPDGLGESLPLLYFLARSISGIEFGLGPCHLQVLMRNFNDFPVYLLMP